MSKTVEELSQELVDVLHQLNEVRPVQFLDVDNDVEFNFLGVETDEEFNRVYIDISQWYNNLPAHVKNPLMDINGHPIRPLN